MTERETTVLLVDVKNNNVDRLTYASELRRMLYLLCPREVRDMDKSVNTLLELYEDTEVSEVTNLSIVLRTYRDKNMRYYNNYNYNKNVLYAQKSHQNQKGRYHIA